MLRLKRKAKSASQEILFHSKNWNICSIRHGLLLGWWISGQKVLLHVLIWKDNHHCLRYCLIISFIYPRNSLSRKLYHDSKSFPTIDVANMDEFNGPQIYLSKLWLILLLWLDNQKLNDPQILWKSVSLFKLHITTKTSSLLLLANKERPTCLGLNSKIMNI